MVWAAPLSSMSLPSTAPKTNTSTRLPMVSPMPFRIDRSAASALIPLRTPTKKDASSSAKNAFSFSRTINSRRSKIESPSRINGIRREQAGPGAHASIGVSLAVDEAAEHRPEAAEVPGHPAIRCVAAAKQVPAERFARQLIRDQIALDVRVALGAKHETDIGAFQTQLPGHTVKLFGLEVAGAAAAHMHGDQGPFGVALGHAAQSFGGRIGCIGS